MMNTIFLQRIHLPEVPEISGLNFRGFQGNVDFPKMAEVIKECNLVDRTERSTDVDFLRYYYTHIPNCNLDQDMLFAECDGTVIGFGRVCWRQELNGDRIYEHFNYLKPPWRSIGIGWAMMKYFQRRLRKISQSHPKDGEYFYESFAANTEETRQSLLLEDGYEAARYFYEMVRPDLDNIPEVPMPEGLDVRPVKPEHYQLIYEASVEAFQDHWGFSEDGERPVSDWLDDPNFDPSLWRVAWDGDQVVGMVRSFIDRKENEEYNRKRGWTEDICVRRPWRRRGLARYLLAQSLQAVKERGMTEAALGVDTNNPQGALKLYQSLGFNPVRQFTDFRKPFE